MFTFIFPGSRSGRSQDQTLQVYLPRSSHEILESLCTSVPAAIHVAVSLVIAEFITALLAPPELYLDSSAIFLISDLSAISCAEPEHLLPPRRERGIRARGVPGQFGRTGGHRHERRSR